VRRLIRFRTVFTGAVLLAGLILFSGGCGVYFNTFFNAKKAFNAAEKVRKSSPTGRGAQSDYKTAIEKARKIVDNHPNSKYYDDALYILAVSYYQTNQFSRAERRFRELLANYAESQYTREVTVYLAKTKLRLGDVDDGMELFETIFNADYDRTYKAEAAIALGEFNIGEKEFELSRSYFMAVRDSLGDETQKRTAQTYIADGYFESFQFNEALGAYLQLLGMNPDKKDEYLALYRSAVCSYRLLRIDDGLEYLNRLIENDIYYDSLGALKLMVAEGYEYDDDLTLAEEMYEEVAGSAEDKLNQAEAFYRLGLIYQYDYDDLKQAKEYYDKAVSASRTSDHGREALQRSSDIGKLETFAKSIDIDSSASQEQIDDAGFTQYLLAELYWFQLNKPDTAILEMQYLIDSFPTAYDVPKAMIALSQMYREHYEDERAADSLLKLMLTEYARTDFVPEALDILGLRGTAADTGYPAFYFHRAEDFLVDEQNYDSAAYYYQYVVDSFPDSKYHLQARFNEIWMNEMYRSPGDSSVIYAYEEFRDSFPGTMLAKEASRRLKYSPSRVTQKRSSDEETEDETRTTPADTIQDEQREDTTGYVDPLQALYIGPEGDTVTDITAGPIQVEEPFEFPTEAYTMEDRAIYLYFQILVDFSGKVVDYVLKIRSPIEELNERASETVASMTFDPLEVSQLVSRFELKPSADGRGYWLVYKYLVEKPDFLR